MRAVEVLIVEDNPGDALLMRQAVGDCSVPVVLHIANNGEKALLMLTDPHPRLDLVILDLNLPKVPGTVLLRVWQTEKRSAEKIPVVVFSSSQDPSERERCLSLGAVDFISKPTDLEDFTEAVCKIVDKWAKPREPLLDVSG